MKRWLRNLEDVGMRTCKELLGDFSAAKNIRTAAKMRLLDSSGKNLQVQCEPQIMRWTRV